MKFVAYEKELEEFCSVIMPFRPFCGLTVMKSEIRILKSDRSSSCGVTVTIMIMATAQVRARFVVCYAERKMLIAVQRNYGELVQALHLMQRRSAPGMTSGNVLSNV
jgi:hypothetical protein